MNCLLTLEFVNAVALPDVRTPVTSKRRRWLWLTTLMICFSTLEGLSTAEADSIALQNATATFSQTFNGGQPVGEAIDGVFGTVDGWAIFDLSSGTIGETAVFETVVDISSVSGVKLEFELHQLWTAGAPGFFGHNLGRFRISATTDDRSEYADGLATGGDVTANWTVLTPICAFSTGGATMNILLDGSILVSGENPDISVYSMTAIGPIGDITGFRLEVLEDKSLPANGPGRFSNGNFTLTEFLVDVVEVLLGDVNRDCVVNLLDVAAFVNLITMGDYQAEADINGDGAVNLLDVSPFVELLSGG